MLASPRVTHWRKMGSLAALGALACFALTACGSAVGAKDTSATASGLCASPQSVQRLTVQRINGLPQNHEHYTFPAQIAVNDSADARAAAEAICALPPMPDGTFACPADLGVAYRLDFTRDGKSLPAVTVNATGCGEVKGAGGTRWTARTPGFWGTLGTAMSIPQASNTTFEGTMP